MPSVTPTDLAAWWAALPPSAGDVTVLALDGRSGAGKTTLAAALAPLVGGSARVAMDGIHPGWDGLAASVPLLVAHVLEPLAQGRPATVPRWDWTADRPAPPRPLPRPPSGLLLIEGIGCGALACTPHLAGLVWLSAPEPLRRERAIARDGDGYAPHWRRWADQEEAYLRAERPDVRADLVLDTGGGTDQVLPVLADRRLPGGRRPDLGLSAGPGTQQPGLP